tara:strand:+ start:914 stop:1120 length:207 start_codon:yes stop_codon:yes gene_type:complete
MKDLNTEEQFIHSMNNKLFALYGKIMAVKGLASDDQLILELNKLETCYKEAQSVLQEYKYYIGNKSNS